MLVFSLSFHLNRIHNFITLEAFSSESQKSHLTQNMGFTGFEDHEGPTFVTIDFLTLRALPSPFSPYTTTTNPPLAPFVTFCCVLGISDNI